MKTLPIGEFKTHFSDVLDRVQQGEEIAVIVPYSHYKQPAKRALGVMAADASCRVKGDFKISTKDFLGGKDELSAGYPCDVVGAF